MESEMQVQDDKTHTLKGKKHAAYNPSVCLSQPCPQHLVSSPKYELHLTMKQMCYQQPGEPIKDKK